MILDKSKVYELFDNNFKKFNYNNKRNHRALKIYFETNCIYFLLCKKEVVYIGQTTSLMQRLNDHYKSDKIFDDYIFYIYIGTEEQRLLQESKLIFHYNPMYNNKFSYTIKEAYLKSFFKKHDILYRFDSSFKEDLSKDSHYMEAELNSCIQLIENELIVKNLMIYSNNKRFIDTFGKICNKKNNKESIDRFDFKELWEKVYYLKKKFNLSIVYKRLYYNKKFI